MSFSEKIQSIQEQMEGFDINDLDFENIGVWPLPVKAVVWVAALILVIFLGHKFIISDMQVDLAQKEAKEIELKEEFSTKAFQAANLEAYRKQMTSMEESFGALVSQLPSDTEVPGLLEDITNKGQASGLTFRSIKLKPESKKEFYVKLPISISAVGTYHDMGAFVSGVASLPRIVTLTNFSIQPVKKGSRDNSKLSMKITANTYRYRDVDKKRSKKKKKKKKKK